MRAAQPSPQAHVSRLKEDPVDARRLAEGLSKLPDVVLDPASVETNIVIFDANGTVDAKQVLAALSYARVLETPGALSLETLINCETRAPRASSWKS